MSSNIIDTIAWWIPIKSIRIKFRNATKKKFNNFIFNKIDFNYVNTNNIELIPNKYNEIFVPLILSNEKKYKKNRNSELINKYLTGLKGVEIGGSAGADFGIDAIQVNIVDANQEHNNYYQQTNILGSGYNQRTDIISCGDVLPFQDNSIDFVFSSHVLEHFYDPIKALKEWYRVIKKDGYIAMIVPHKERTFDKDRDRTTLNELIERHNKVKNYKYNVDERGMHFSVWITEDILELCKYLNMNVIEYLDVDDAVGNGFAIIIKK
ncbi:class I SAM-dependent methyltransferase [Brachyspira hyodysenteriae]|uniref:class I SAM-dependent methyltransferase n=1 Tax=Brachyspira hyodysenteriae TaxID=159 RepID=UPI00069C58C9|nr:class I SAM-dependent methyltransferase [Brachyspira hyodysenteriae]